MTTRNHPAGTKAMQSRSMLGQLAVWRSRLTSRRELAAMDARMLRDIGLSSSLAYAEASKRFWQV